MAASKSPAATVPEEILRQSERISEQATCLVKIIDLLQEHLDNVIPRVRKANDAASNSIRSLKNSLTTYSSIAKSTYQNISEKLRDYSLKTTDNFEEMDASIKNVCSEIEKLSHMNN